MTVAGWVTLICGFALWPVALIWAYVDVPASRSSGATAMMIALMAVLSGAAVRAGAASGSSASTCSGSLAFHRAAAAQSRPVHPDGVGRAAGAGAGRAQCRRDRAERRGRSDRCSGRARIRRSRPATCCSDRSRRPIEAQVKAIEAQLKLPRLALPDDAIVRARFRPRLRCRAAAVRGRPAQGRSSKARSGISTRPSSARRPTATSPTSRCARARGSPTCRWRR